MKISVFGMGYVGGVTSACLVKEGHTVIGVDIVESKVEALNQGRWPIFEPGIDELVDRERMEKCLRATSSTAEGIRGSSLSIICVGTPSHPAGGVDLTYVRNTVHDIQKALMEKDSEHTILIRSTIPPGTTESLLMPVLKKGALRDRIEVAFYPEFLREGSAIHDFFHPSLNILGCEPGFPKGIMKEIFPSIPKGPDRTDIRTAEAIKYANNSFHALKIAFTNELASLFCQYGVDNEKLMEIFCKDRVLNISPYYLRPGFAFGGSCLPKDVKAVIAMSKEKNMDVPLFRAVLASNDQLIERFVMLVAELGADRIGFAGAAFKPNTDDIRESPIVEAIKRIMANDASYRRKKQIFVCDLPAVGEKVIGKAGTDVKIIGSPEELIARADVVVLGPLKIGRTLQKKIMDSGKRVIDLKWHRVMDELREYPHYYSIT
jgi:GDP-mannose 6-dehydrogenase